MTNDVLCLELGTGLMSSSSCNLRQLRIFLCIVYVNKMFFKVTDLREKPQRISKWSLSPPAPGNGAGLLEDSVAALSFSLGALRPFFNSPHSTSLPAKATCLGRRPACLSAPSAWPGAPCLRGNVGHMSHAKPA